MWDTGRKAKCVGMESTGNIALVLPSLQKGERGSCSGTQFPYKASVSLYVVF